MNQPDISIRCPTNTGPAGESAARIAKLIKEVLLDCDHTDDCLADLSLLRFENGPRKAIVTAKLAGTINKKSVNVSEAYAYSEENHSQLATVAKSPMFGLFMAAFETAYHSNDPAETADQQLARAEFTVASKIARKLQDAVSAPVNFVTSFWHKVLWISGIFYTLAVALIAIASYQRFQMRHAEFFESLGMSLFFAFIFSIPAGVGAIFLGLLLFHPSDIGTSVHGQALFRFVGVQSRSGLITVSAIGAVIGIGIYAIMVWCML